MRIGIAAFVGGASLLAASSALAHHSFAMFDRTVNTVLTGTITQFEWTNPHAFIELEVPGAGGAPKRWSVELNSPNNLKRNGWKSTSLKAGDKVTLTLNPLREGKPGGLFVSVKLPDGSTLN